MIIIMMMIIYVTIAGHASALIDLLILRFYMNMMFCERRGISV